MLQKEAFSGVEKLKKESADISNDADSYKAVRMKKVGYQPDPIANRERIYGPNPNNKKTQNMWQMVDDGFGSSRDFSNITGINGANVGVLSEGAASKSEGGGMGSAD